MINLMIATNEMFGHFNLMSPVLIEYTDYPKVTIIIKKLMKCLVTSTALFHLWVKLDPEKTARMKMARNYFQKGMFHPCDWGVAKKKS